MKRIFTALIILVALAAMTARVNAQSVDTPASPQSSATDPVPSPLGTWEVTATFPDGFKSKGILTFGPGANSSDTGSLFATADVDLTFPVPCTNQQGVWARTSGRNFDTTTKGFCYSSSFEPFGTLKIRQKITLGPLGNGFTGKATIEIIRRDGSIEFTVEGTLRGSRMNVESLP